MTKIGLDENIVVLHSYSPEWEKFYEIEAIRLKSAVGDFIIDIQHVGSTSIPGMPAKPIIDIGIAVTDFFKAEICIEPIKRLGYDYKGEHGISKRHYFDKGDPSTHHLHVLEIESDDWNNHLFFRDYLTSHPEMAKKYADLKISLARKFKTNRDAYQDGKTSLITKILQNRDNITFHGK
ncbi:MAG: GrpB family protein [Candidatus Hodarchaeales archaeon]|jgi:GrpB-like predicted nucleotidyltransferase (UPF0157 family)